MSKYEIDFSVFVTQRLPFVLRKPKHIGWLLALINPLKNLHTSFKILIAQWRKHAQITPSRRILRGALNDAFDPIERRITITDGGTDAYLYIFNVSEEKPVSLPIFIQGTSAVSFKVGVPSNLSNKVVLIRQFVNRYKLPVLQFIIQLT